MKYFAFVITLSVALTSCVLIGQQGPEKLNCPTYDATFLNTWFPYTEGNTYYFKDSTGNRHFLEIQHVMYRNGDEVEEGWNCMPATECYPSGNISAYRDRDQEDRMWLSVIHSYDKSEENLVMIVNGHNTYMLVNSDGSIRLDPTYYDRPEDYYKEYKPDFIHHDKLSLNEVTYTDVYEVTYHKNDMGDARTYYFAKGHGIVGYSTFAGSYYGLEQ
ncbi:MAG: hypothetical protein KDC11_10600 [Chitinophagaceae bacterium]|nr:hypothetical protein [Chitinophagaceae bacterium]